MKTPSRDEQIRFIVETGMMIRNYFSKAHALALNRTKTLGPWQDLSMQQVSVGMLARRHRNMTVTELARMLGISPPSASAMVERLVAKGILSRSRSSEDRRKVVIALAPDAERHLRKMQIHLEKAMAQLVDRIGEETALQWFNVMQQVRRAIDSETKGPDDETQVA